MPLSFELRDMIRRRDRYKCVYCGIFLGDGFESVGVIDRFQPDRTYPDPQKDITNLVLSCYECNKIKGAKFDERLLHPLKEDYLFHMHEDPTFNILVPSTERGKVTIDILKLNRDTLVHRRRQKRILLLERISLSEKFWNKLEELEGKTTDELTGIYRELIQEDEKPLVISENGETIKIEVIDWVKTEKELTVYLMSYLKKYPGGLDDLDPYVFEKLIAEYFASTGCVVELVSRDQRTGADILAIRTDDSVGLEIRYMIEVKRWKDKIGIEEVRTVHGAMCLEKPIWGWDVGLIVTLSGFKDFRSTNKDDLAKMGIYLKDRKDVIEYLKAYKPRPDGGLWLSMGWDKTLVNKKV